MKTKMILAAVMAVTISVTASVAQKRKLTLAEIADFRNEALARNLPHVTGWADDDHLLMSELGKGTVAVEVGTGKRVPYKPAGRPRDEAHRDMENRTLSPDGKWAAYTKDNNLYATEIATGRTVQYTTDGSATVLNGKLSWVYYEEIFGREDRAFWWSPDSRTLAFFRTDESQVPTFPVFNNEGQHGTLTLTRYPKAGDPNPQVRLGFVPVEGGPAVWADFDPAEDHYLGRPFWAPDGTLWTQWMPRRQNELKIYSVNPASGAKSAMIAERHDTWVEWKKAIHFIKDGYLMQSNVEDWDHIYLFGKDGRMKKDLTGGRAFWRTEVLRVDEKAGIVYFSAHGESPLRCDVYSVRLDGKSLRRLTPGDYHNQQVSLSPGGKYLVTRYSNLDTPMGLAVIDTRTGKKVMDMSGKSDRFDSIERDNHRIVWYTSSDGLRLPAIVTEPAVIDPSRKYPVIIYTYAGPDHPLVTDRWSGGASWYAHEGIIRVVLDHRGSGHLGRKGLDYIYRNLGKYELSDFTDFIRGELYTKPYIDRDRIAIEGHSYGGYITALAVTRGAEYFRYGIASAGVMDWSLYDSHYTERYMDTPQNNPEGYKESSVLSYISDYTPSNMLYIRYGLLDDNVHPQNSLQLIYRLQLAGKVFESVAYPQFSHSFIDRSVNNAYNDMLRFWYRNLLPGRDIPAELLRKLQ